MFDEEFYDNEERSQPIARCAECQDLIYDNNEEVYMDEHNNYFCCLDCALNHHGIRQLEEFLC